MTKLTASKEWRALAQHQKAISRLHMRDWFAADRHRSDHFSLRTNGLFLDYSRHRITKQTLSLLFDLAQAVKLREQIEDLFTGHPVNISENRAALHTALRNRTSSPIGLNGNDLSGEIKQSLEKMRDLACRMRNQEQKGATGKPLSFIVNIGIGGSHWGPMFCAEALQQFKSADLHFFFLPTIDKSQLHHVLKQIDPEQTLFIIASKSFTTLETLTNARTILQWMKDQYGEKALSHHFAAITAAPEKALTFGISPELIFPLWDWVGGRYSIWSAIGLPLMMQIGPRYFQDFLDGAYEMDQHFRNTDFAQNMPVLLALLHIWYVNFFGVSSQAIIPYSYRLRYLIPYLQQVEMESNGKNMDRHGRPIDYLTGSIIFGEEGCNGQHTYHQLLHQGQHLIPVDFILTGHDEQKPDPHHQILTASAMGQAQALMKGKTYAEAYRDLIAAQHSHEEAERLAAYQVAPGNRPSSILCLKQLTPKNLGALLALYEHKTFTQSAIWDINPFDQWGVELGKQLSSRILTSPEEKQCTALE